MGKKYRRFIRVNGELISSPEFSSKKDATLWYDEMRRKKQFARHSIVLPDGELTVLGFAKEWMRERVKNYPEATWASDDQRLRDYVLPEIGPLLLSEVTHQHIKSLLNKITDSGLSTNTRTRVKALMSKLFGDAMDKSIIPLNPALRVKFSEKRISKKRPDFFFPKEASEYLKNAKSLGYRYEAFAILTLFAGLRKSEIAGLQWGDINVDSSFIYVRRRIEQVSSKIRLGTKAGENSERTVPMSKDLILRFLEFKKTSKFKKDTDFILATNSGRFPTSSVLFGIHQKIILSLPRQVSIHALRHTFGRQFVINGGSIKALQSIMGHSSSSVTDIYSDLSGDHLRGLGNVVTYSRGALKDE